MPSSNDDPVETSMMEFWLQNKATDDIADYAMRGRKFRDLTDEALQSEWTNAMRAWAMDLHDKATSNRRSDLEAEFTLRGAEPDRSDVADAVAKLKMAAIAAYKKLLEDPDKLEKVNEELTQELIEYVDKSERGH